ncbi:MAG: hypothetical protein JRH19_22135 [Deltaproteobacteria bacterium]|nr:hypothetical protein [Deltaproteobacteria bacterium]
MTPTRRELLLSSLGFVVGLAAGSDGARARSPREAAAGGLLDGVAHPDSTRAVGWAYLRRHPEEADEQRLIEALVGEDSELRAALQAQHPKRVRSRLRRRHRDDFGAQRTVVLEGWVLSRTETRLAALAALSGPA